MYTTKGYYDSRFPEEIRKRFESTTARLIERLDYFDHCPLDEILKRLASMEASWHEGLSPEEIRQKFKAHGADDYRSMHNLQVGTIIEVFGHISDNGKWLIYDSQSEWWFLDIGDQWDRLDIGDTGDTAFSA